MDEFQPAIIMDNGSGTIKIGISGDKQPRFIYPNIIGRAKAKAVMIGAGQRDFFVGEEAQTKRGILSIKYPVEHGVITSWEDMELIWKHAYSHNLKIKPSERPALITEPPLNPLSNREKMAEVFFEKFEVPAMYVAIQAVLALYYTGKVTGCVLDTEDGVTHSVPIFEGYCLPHAVLRLDLGGSDLTEYLMRILSESGICLVSTAEREIVKDIKEHVCYVAVDLDAEKGKKLQELETEYKLPDGKVIHIHSQRYRCPETLFAPANIGMEAPGIDRLCFSTIMKSDLDLRTTLFSNIILTGGSSLFPGIDLRLAKELTKMVPADSHVDVSAPHERELAVWMGGSILLSLSDFQRMWINMAEFQEIGPNIVHKKCF